MRNKLIKIRKFLEFIDHPLARDIQLPKLPKRRKNVIKVEHIRKLLNDIGRLREKSRLRLKAAILLSATSGIRAEELYRLRPEILALMKELFILRPKLRKTTRIV